jgi:zinc ribbon protein
LSCPNCGRGLLDDFSFCPYCGIALGSDKPAAIVKAYSIKEVRRNHPQAYAKWDKGEDETLTKEFADRLSLSKIAELHGRNEGAIRSRLEKLGLLQRPAAVGDREAQPNASN